MAIHAHAHTHTLTETEKDNNNILCLQTDVANSSKEIILGFLMCYTSIISQSRDLNFSPSNAYFAVLVCILFCYFTF